MEAVSCDEMYVNLTDLLKILDCSVDDFVAHIRNEIIQKTQCPCSAGIGENKFVIDRPINCFQSLFLIFISIFFFYSHRLQARMATKKAKPNGQFYLLAKDVENYFRDILISDLPGVGYSTTQKLTNLQMNTCADLQQMTLSNLQKEFGRKLGEMLHQYCRGIDIKPLTYNQVGLFISILFPLIHHINNDVTNYF